MTTNEWQSIDTAPRDGTFIALYHEGWDVIPIGAWGEYPGNPVLDENNKECWMFGWLLKEEWLCPGEEEGFLGWDEDTMPTHWMPLPTPPEKKDA